jgi:hypothetical protein
VIIARKPAVPLPRAVGFRALINERVDVLVTERVGVAP